MSNDHYNYSVSLIRRSSDTWMIDPEDASAQAFYSELLGKGLGEHYLATKTLGELSYCVFLSGDVCHSDVYGWIITLNGWRLLDLDAYLQLSQQIWEEFALVSSRGDIRQILHGIIDEKRLLPHSTPAPIDRNVEHSYHALTFTPKSSLRCVLIPLREVLGIRVGDSDTSGSLFLSSVSLSFLSSLHFCPEEDLLIALLRIM